MTACDVFHISYDDVQQAYALIHNLQMELEQCKLLCENMDYSYSYSIRETCSDDCEQSYQEGYSEILSGSVQSARMVAHALLGVEEPVASNCVPYWKDSTVGNCYVHEYVFLNRGSASSGTFTVESTTTEEGKYFQCRANERANDGEQANQFECRSVFSTTTARLEAVGSFVLSQALPAVLGYNECIDYVNFYGAGLIGGALAVFQYQQCMISFNYDMAIVYSACILQHDVHDCKVHAAMYGFDVTGCPDNVFRRESTVDGCSVVDLIDLHNLNAIQEDDDGNEQLLIADSCFSSIIN
ncbi:hypothetical protein FGB62_147g010 [Gracilaria domingensis]|nr:hypothetical protein FGB62_147g010 [Gracilaria domingensis]